MAEYNRFDQSNDTGVQRRYFDESMIHDHEGFSDATLEFDFALIKINEPFVDHPVLVKINADPNVPQINGLKVLVAGWGRTEEKGDKSNVLQYTRLSYVPQQECLERFGGQYIKDSMMCAYEEGMDACQGGFFLCL